MIKDDLVPLASAAAGRYSDEFLRGIDRALAVKPADRPQNIAELRDLLHIDSSIATSSYDKTQFQVQPARNTRRRSPVMLAGLVVTGLVLAGTGLYVMFIQSPEIVRQTATAPHPVNIAPVSSPGGGSCADTNKTIQPSGRARSDVRRAGSNTQRHCRT